MTKTEAEKSRQRRARRYVKGHADLILLHALYQRWGLPTVLLKPLFRNRGPIR